VKLQYQKELNFSLSVAFTSAGYLVAERRGHLCLQYKNVRRHDKYDNTLISKSRSGEKVVATYASCVMSTIILFHFYLEHTLSALTQARFHSSDTALEH